MLRATSKSGALWSKPASLLGLGTLLIGTGHLAAAVEAGSPEAAAAGVYREVKARHVAEPGDAEGAWSLGRACFDLAEFATNQTQRAALAREGIAACQAALTLCSTSAPAHYFLGMNRGQLARTTTLGAIKLVDAMERDFWKARELDPALEEAGPDRNLGLLYHLAPGWPVSVGSRNKARQRLLKAVEVAPLYPENRLNLMEAYAAWGELERLPTELKAWDALLAKVRERYTGERWRWDWPHWERRLAALRKLLPEPETEDDPSPPSGTPNPAPPGKSSRSDPPSPSLGG